MRALAPFALGGLLLAASVAQAQPGAALPESPGVEVLRSRCLACHQTDLIEQQRLTPAAWTREVAKMERWGVQLTDPQREALVGYLAMHFGPRPRLALSSRVDAEVLAHGETTLQRACRPCHGLDLMQQQRLPRAGWEREVDKMIRWGAKVEDTEKGALVAFLTARWGPR